MMGAFAFGASPVLDLCEINEIVHLLIAKF